MVYIKIKKKTHFDITFWISTCCSVTKSCPTLCKSPWTTVRQASVLHYLPEFAQTHIHWVGDAIQPSQPLLLPFPFAFNLSQHQSFPTSWLFASGGQSTGASVSASVLSMNILGWCPLQLTGFRSPCYPRNSQVFSSTTIWKHQFINSLALNLLYGPTLTSVHGLLEKP